MKTSKIAIILNTFYRIMVVVFVINVSSMYAQHDVRIGEIKKLYADYNESLMRRNTAQYEITLNVHGELNEISVYTDLEDKMVVSSTVTSDVMSEKTDYYFKKDTLQFVYKELYETLDHWSRDTIHFRQAQSRYYFSKGNVIYALQKEFLGVEGIDQDPDLSTILNKAIEVSPTIFEDKATVLKELSKNLNAIYFKF